MAASGAMEVLRVAAVGRDGVHRAHKAKALPSRACNTAPRLTNPTKRPHAPIARADHGDLLAANMHAGMVVTSRIKNVASNIPVSAVCCGNFQACAKPRNDMLITSGRRNPQSAGFFARTPKATVRSNGRTRINSRSMCHPVADGSQPVSYVLNLNSITSPSLTTYSLPSSRALPCSLAGTSPPRVT
jgi:hypothetical protein